LLNVLRPLLDTLEAHLFTNNLLPGEGDDPSDFVEPEAAWYKPLKFPYWAPPFVGPDGLPACYSGNLVWESTQSGPVQIYGWFVLDNQGRLCWAETDPHEPFTLNSGGQYVVTPRFSLRQDRVLFIS